MSATTTAPTPSSRVPVVVACATAAAVLVASFVRVQQAGGGLGKVADFVAVAVLGFAIAWLAAHPPRRARRVWWCVAPLLAGALVAASWPRITSLVASDDASRAFGVVLLFGGAGLGLRGTGTLAWGLLTFAPFALVVVAGSAWLPLLGTAWTIVLAAAIGTRLAEQFLKDAATTPLVLRVLLGLTCLAPAVLLLGLVGLCAAELLVFAAAVATIVLRHACRESARALLATLATPPPACASQALVRGAMIGMFVVYLVAALGPETGWDATALRVAAPARWLEAGSITALPQLLSTYGVCGGEMLSLWLMPFGGHSATRLLAFATGLLLAHSLCRDVLPRRGLGALLVFPLLGSSLIWWQMSAGLVDLLQALHFYGMAVAFHRWHEHHGRDRDGWLVLAALCAGGAAAIKWNGGLALLILGALVLLQRGVPKGRPLLKVALAFGAVVLPWVVRSVWLTGNPVFPFANGWFASELAATTLARNPFGDGPLWSLPIDVFLDPARFGEQGGFHPALLGLLPLALGGLRTARGHGWWLAAATLAFGLWAVTEQNARYGLFVAIFAVAGLGRCVDAWHARLQSFERGLVVWTLAVIGVLGFGVQRGLGGAHYWDDHCDALFPAEVVFGSRSVEAHLTRHVETYAAAQWLGRGFGTRVKIWVRPPLRGDNLYLPGLACRRPHGILPLMTELEDSADVSHILDRGTGSYEGFSVRFERNGVRLLERPQQHR